MCRKIILLVYLLVVAGVPAWGQETPALADLISTARIAKDSLTDPSALHQIASDLGWTCTSNPGLREAPAGCLLAAQLEVQAGRADEALKLASFVVDNFPATVSARDAFEIAWALVSQSGEDPLPGARLAFRMASARAADPSALQYYRLAFEAYHLAGDWKKAVEVGANYLDKCLISAPDAALLLDLVDVSLKSGDTGVARLSLTEYIAHFPDKPHAVYAHTKLAEICTADDEPELVHENYSRAWSIYQKNRKRGEYNQPEIARSAATALWLLQTELRKDYERSTAPDLPLTKIQIQQAAELEQAYADVMKVDPERAAEALSAIGDIHSRLGDAYLGQGFRAAMAAPDDPQPPYIQAIPEYAMSVSAYSRAWEYAAAESPSPEATRLARYAAERQFEVAIGEGDAILGWAIDRLVQAPAEAPGSNGGEARFSYIATVITPLVADALTHKQSALTTADRMPIIKLADAAREGLDYPIRPIAAQLAGLAATVNNSVAAQASQLSNSHSRGFSAVADAGIMDEIETDFTRATRFYKDGGQVLDQLYENLAASKIPAAAQIHWDSLMVAWYGNYAEVCRSVQTEFAVCLANLPNDEDENVRGLRKRLTKLQNKSASEEYASLVRWHDWAVLYDVANLLSAPLAARLSELNPERFPIGNDLPSASRRKP